MSFDTKDFSDTQLPDGSFVTQIDTTTRRWVEGFSGAAYAAGAASKAALTNWDFVRDTGGITITLANGNLTLGMGTTNGAELLMVGKVDLTHPANIVPVVNVSQRIAGNEIRIGVLEVDANGAPVANPNQANFFNNHAGVLFNGTTTTTVVLETNCDSQAAAMSVSMTSLSATNAALEYPIELRPEDICATQVAANTNVARAVNAGRISSVVPNPNKRYRPFIWVRNVSLPASNTNVILSRFLVMDVQELQAEVAGRGNAAGGQSIPVHIAQSVASQGVSATVTNAQLSSGTNSSSIAKILSAATTNATSVKASAGRVSGGYLLNTGAAVCFVRLFNKASAPTVGTDVPVAVIALPPNVPVCLASIWDQYGFYFATGIAYAITNLVADLDATAIAASQVVGFLEYA